MYALASIGAIAWYLWWRKQPRRTGDGRLVLTDHADSLVHGGGYLLGVVAAVAFCGAITWMGARAGELPRALLLDAILIPAVLFVGWLMIKDVRVGRPGKLVLPSWPLVEGRPIAVDFVRPLRGEARLRSCQAALVLYEKTRRRNQTVTRRLAAVPLGSGGARIVDGAIVARWEFEVPDATAGRLGHGVWGRLFGAMSGCYWMFEVKTPLDTNDTADSRFPVTIAHDPTE